MTAKHTPGPWLIGKKYSDFIVLQDGVTCVARVITSHGQRYGEMNSNAALIAAAPELLEALQQAEMAMAGYMHRNDVIDAALVKARSAIEKATIGELDAAMKENP